VRKQIESTVSGGFMVNRDMARQTVEP